MSPADLSTMRTKFNEFSDGHAGLNHVIVHVSRTKEYLPLSITHQTDVAQDGGSLATVTFLKKVASNLGPTANSRKN